MISGPSGVGKGTVVRRLLQLHPDLFLSVSCTTRPPRPGEVDGREYRFVPEERFQEFIDRGVFLEWAKVYGHRSGTPVAPLEDALRAGRDAVLEIDVQGADIVRRRVPDAVLIFLSPPSEEELARRLRERRTEGEPELARRLAAAREEMAQAAWFHHVVVNDDADRAAAEVASIIKGSRSHR